MENLCKNINIQLRELNSEITNQLDIQLKNQMKDGKFK